MKEKKCEHCGTVFKGNRNKQFCPECLKYRQKQQRKESDARKKAKAIEAKISKNKLLSDVREAKKLGISYGAYKARQTERACEWWI